jgi:hypothetical protein
MENEKKEKGENNYEKKTQRKRDENNYEIYTNK